MSDKKGSSVFAWGFLAGAVAAAVYTLLKTPRAGHETIEQIKGEGAKLKTRAGELAGGLRRQADDTTTAWYEAAQPAPQYWQADLQDAVQQAQSTATEMAQDGQEQATEAVEAVQAEASDLAEAAEEVKESLVS